MDPLRKKIQFYRYLYLFNQFHNHTYLYITIPFRLAVLGLFSVTGGVVLIRVNKHNSYSEHFLVIQSFLWATLLPFLFIHVSGKVFKTSVKLVAGFSRYSKYSLSKSEKKAVRCLRPFGVRVGPIKALTYGALSAFYFIVVKSLTTTLVSIPPDPQN